MIHVGEYEIKTLIYEKFRENKCICTNSRLENELIYLYLALQCNAINASTTYKYIIYEVISLYYIYNQFLLSNEEDIEDFFHS